VNGQRGEFCSKRWELSCYYISFDWVHAMACKYGTGDCFIPEYFLLFD